MGVVLGELESTAAAGMAVGMMGRKEGKSGSESRTSPFYSTPAKDAAHIKRAAGASNALPQMLVHGQDVLARSPLFRALDEQPDGAVVVVDVGGNRGHTSMALTDATSPRVRFVVQDLPGPVALGEAGARVVCCDRLMPEAAVAGYEQREARFSDLTMLQLLNGRERSEMDWTKLFAEADSRFDIEFEHWTGNLHGLIKATWKP